MSGITVRVARKADIGPLDEVFQRSYPKLLRADYPPSTLVIAIPIIARAQPALVLSGTYYVAEDEAGRLLGAGGWTRSNPHGGPLAQGHAHLRHFATDAGAARRGVGRAIFERCLSAAVADGVTALECYSTLTAVPFYAALGFHEVAKIVLTLRPGITFAAVHMVRGL
jgi:GNAT superfamily N-acetyltransferase